MVIISKARTQVRGNNMNTTRGHNVNTDAKMKGANNVFQEEPGIKII